MANESRPPQAAHQPIPGERDPHNLTTREPGAVGGQFTGADIPPEDHLPWLDRITAEEHAREGGLSGKQAKKQYER
ncbi:MAG TPA: hypothetical protein VFO21_05045 [Vicinamibacterales bacterium]|jgi:hypothetical protein|nr:hypothetical protein [Vicinamibacterales bacterium]